MCLAVPGKLVELSAADATGPTGLVDFQGSRITVSLACTPEAVVGDWLLVHSGFAISRLDEDEARETWELLRSDPQFADMVPPELAAGGDSAP